MSNEINITERASFLVKTLNEFFQHYQPSFEGDNNTFMKDLSFQVLNETYLILGNIAYINKFMNQPNGFKYMELDQFIGKLENSLKWFQNYSKSLHNHEFKEGEN